MGDVLCCCCCMGTYGAWHVAAIFQEWVDGMVHVTIIPYLTSASFFFFIGCWFEILRNTKSGFDLFGVRSHWSISRSRLVAPGSLTLYRYAVQSDWIRLVFLLLGASYETHRRWQTCQVSNERSRLRLWCHGLVQ